MNTGKLTAAGLAAVLMLNGCASTPMGPTVRAFPPANKPFEVFQADQATCKEYAKSQVAGEADSANAKGVGAALLGAAVGAGLGAAAGGGRGAGTGAAVGGGLGTAVGAGSSAGAQRSIQQQYDNSYAECMTSKGNQVQQTYRYAPVTVVQPVYAPPPPPPPMYAPPPGGYAPPPGAVPVPPPGGSAPPPPPGVGPY